MHMEDVVTALFPIFGDRVYATAFPQFAAPLERPMCRYLIVGVVPFPAACGDGSRDDDDPDDEDDYTADVSFQLDVIADEYDQCVALRKATRKAIKAIETPMICTFWQMLYDVETDCHRAVLRYTVHDSSEP